MTHPLNRSLACRVVSTPHLHDGGAAHARFDDWLSEIASTPAAAKLRELSTRYPMLHALMLGVAGGSPYLWDLMRASPERLIDLLEAEPERRFDNILGNAKQAAAATHDEAELMRVLRRMKADAALLIALGDVGGIWPIRKVIDLQTQVADAAVSAAVDYLISDAQRRGRLRIFGPGHKGLSYIVLAMGKMGAGELNYSSDIDLIVFYGGAAVSLDVDLAPFYVRFTRALIKLLQERTSDGYVFRTDLRLRPDPSSTQIVISTTAALHYYETRGQNWERAALIKARPCAGDIAGGEALLAALSPFVWRKHLDFAAVTDVHALKRQIHAYRGHDQIAVEGHNIKLGRGGIREIEFFVQTQQLIAGGRHPELRIKATLPALDALADGGWIDRQARDELRDAYCFLRVVENRLQMLADEQSHTLPTEPDGLEQFARFAGFPSRDAFADTLLVHLRNVQRHYAALFENVPAVERDRHMLFSASASDRGERPDQLATMGFGKPAEVSELVRRWHAGAYGSLRSPFARSQLVEIVPTLLHQFARSANPDAAVIGFDRFLSGLHSSGRLFSLLRQNTDLIALIALILGTAPRLADSLAQFPEVMDAIVDPSFFGALPEESELALSLDGSLRQAATHEDFLERIRAFAQEQMFLIGTRILSGTVSAEQAGEAFARLADVLLRSLHRTVDDEFAKLHGRIADQQTAILALGKLGGREMTATSDLDLIVVYDFDSDAPESDGPRPLYGAQYFSRLTQRLIGALTARTNYGTLYQVDMRLRPSGRSGPLATQIDGFLDYQQTQAWTWEHMALTRARIVSAAPQFAARLEGVIRTVLCRSRDAAMVAGDVVEMRNAIAREKDAGNRWDLKYAVGGLLDIEFIAQYLQLIHGARLPEILDTATARVLDKAWRLGVLAVEDAEVLRPAVRLYHDLTQILRLCLSGPFDPHSAAPGLIGLLARAADVPDFATLDAFIGETQAKVRASFTRILGG